MDHARVVMLAPRRHGQRFSRADSVIAAICEQSLDTGIFAFQGLYQYNCSTDTNKAHSTALFLLNHVIQVEQIALLQEAEVLRCALDRDVERRVRHLTAEQFVQCLLLVATARTPKPQALSGQARKQARTHCAGNGRAGALGAMLTEPGVVLTCSCNCRGTIARSDDTTKASCTSTIFKKSSTLAAVPCTKPACAPSFTVNAHLSLAKLSSWPSQAQRTEWRFQRHP